MVVVKMIFRASIVLLILSFLAACVAKKDLILPNKQQRVTAVQKYKQCVAYATNQHINQNRDPETIARESMHKCRASKYTMLKDYPKGWRDNYEKKIDQEVLQQEISYIVSARRGDASR
ncbi:MAG: hypothetical protein PVF34_08340 [Gammaproteobacteria bacterium]|jgi:predicted small lipoprotein YifL